MILLQQTGEIQHKVGNYCRTGEEQDIPGITSNRMHHYRRLVFNVVKNTMKQAYPLTLQVLGEKEFTVLVDDFFRNHNPQTPQVWKLPKEFYDYAIEANYQEKTGKIWLNDLLLFEWIEIEVHTMPDTNIPLINPDGNIFKDPLLCNPEARLIQINYPIHLKNIHEAEKLKGNYFVLVCRHPETGHVNFFNLSLLHAWVYENIATSDLNIGELIPEIKLHFGIEDEEKIIKNLESFLSDLLDKKAILGFKK
jgi:uncharacterized protein